MTFRLDYERSTTGAYRRAAAAEEILWLASVRPDGRPHLVPVWFLWEGETILLFSKPENQKIRNLRQNPAVSVSLDNSDHGDDVTVLEGIAAIIDDPELTATLPTYASKYATLLAELGWTAETMAKEYSQAIRITITRQLAI